MKTTTSGIRGWIAFFFSHLIGFVSFFRESPIRKKEKKRKNETLKPKFVQCSHANTHAYTHTHAAAMSNKPWVCRVNPPCIVSLLPFFFCSFCSIFPLAFLFSPFFENLFRLLAHTQCLLFPSPFSPLLNTTDLQTHTHTKKSPQLGVEQEAGALPNSFSLSFFQFQKNISCNLCCCCVILCFTCSYFWTPKPKHSLCFVSVVHVGLSLSLSVPFPLHHLVCLLLFFLQSEYLPRTHKTLKKTTEHMVLTQTWFGLPSLHWFLYFNKHM